MQNTQNRCSQLRRLHTNLILEINALKQALSLEEYEGVANPIETVNILKSLQNTLQLVENELEKCPPEP
ncbi:MAG TPA: hypothetical protein VKV20_16435 [Ktedonobacteraceae bacterium]|jgi:hypothetical protein|nr:hypothetical protein [Ktedonobacteraceae bacterium]